MNKNAKIWEWSDSDFLNFLYTERDREYSKHSEWGVNFWAVGAAIIGLLGYAYHAISEDYCSFDWRLFLYYSTVIGDLMILGTILLLPLIKRDRWVNKYRVTTIRYNAPAVAIWGKTVIAYNSFRWLLKLKDYDAVVWLWGSLLVFEILICVYLLVNQNKLIKISQRGHIFGNNVLEWIYRIVEGGICVSILLISLHVWGNQYYMEVKEFEMACVFAIIVGLLWLAFYRMLDKRYRLMDRWIDQYIYGTLTKEEAYLYLLEYSQDYDIVDILRDEYEKIKPLQNYISKWSEKHKEYIRLIDEGKLELDDCKKYLTFIDNETTISKKLLNKCTIVNDKIKEIVKLEALPASMDLFNKLINAINSLEDDVFECIEESNKICKELKLFVTSFMCTKYGGMCGVENCEHRNDKMSFKYRIKRIWKMRCIKITYKSRK